MERSEVKSNQLKLVTAGIGASAVVAMGALTVVFSEASTGNVGAGGISLGTTTTTTPPTVPPTSVATPVVTATTPSGFGNRP
jgi:hypothetical protein